MKLDFIYISKTGVTAILFFLIYLTFITIIKRNNNNYPAKINFKKLLIYGNLTFVVGILFILIVSQIKVPNYYIFSSYFPIIKDKVIVTHNNWKLSFLSPVSGNLRSISFFFDTDIRSVSAEDKFKVEVRKNKIDKNYDRIVKIKPIGHSYSIRFDKFLIKQNNKIDIIFDFNKYINKKSPLRLSKIKSKKLKLFINNEEKSYTPNIRIYILRYNKIFELLYYFLSNNIYFWSIYVFIFFIILIYLLLDIKNYFKLF